MWECDRTKGLGLGAVNFVTVTRKYMRETSRPYGLFQKVCLYRSILASTTVSGDKNVLLFLVPFSREILDPAFR